MKKHPRSNRGFSLLIASALLVLVGIGVAMVQDLAMYDAVASAYEASQINADYIAEAGLNRTRAWLSEMAQTEADFDLALDPGLNTTCSYGTGYPGGAVVTYGGTTSDDHLPPFGGTSSTDINSNLPFHKVVFGGGAFYVRIDDNSDDGHEGWNADIASSPGTLAQRNNYFPRSTNNRESSYLALPGTAGLTCPEAASEEINALRDNQARDRDRIVLVTVVGIFPGTDFAQARARRSYRLYLAPARLAPGIAANGNITQAANDAICGATAGMHANGNLTLNGCQCGDITAAGTTGGTATACGTPTPCPTCMSVPPRESEPMVIPPVNAWNSKYMNFFRRTASKECYFFFGKNSIGYFWDFNRTYSTFNCGAFPTSGSVSTPRPCGDDAVPSLDTTWAGNDTFYTTNDDYCGCWVPVYYDDQGNAAVDSSNKTSPVNPYVDTDNAGGCQSLSGYCPFGNGADKGVQSDGCSGVNEECTGDDEWAPTRNTGTAGGGTYAYGTLCNGFAPQATPREVFHTHAGTKHEFRNNQLTDADLPDAVIFFDGNPTETLLFSSASVTLTLGAVTPMKIEVSSNFSLQAPTWARDYLLVSSSTEANACDISSNGTMRGQIVCQGDITLASNMVVEGNLVSAGGNITLPSNVTVRADPSMRVEIEIPVKPVVWSEATF
ncbi:MAG: hypothetical protein HY904_24585 [Deltaproteobacteria bacterium]|nr:hypothetical protein [Deltaproteobacteria bacterium]